VQHYKRGVSPKVFVLDKAGKALMPCHPARAREFLRKGRAVVVKQFPFTIRLKDRIGGDVQPVEVKIDPGSKVTGLALVSEGRVVHLSEVTHRGGQVRQNLSDRRAFRRRRRGANLRYRAPRFNNRTRKKGWLPPSIQSRVDNTLSWVERYRGLVPVSSIVVERVKFDLQKLENPEISGVEYQQGTLLGYEVREYILEKWDRCCAYCGVTTVPLQIEHIVPRARGGSDRVSNLTLACEGCNQEKGAQPVEVFLKDRPNILQRILSQAKRPLKDAAAVNASRNAVYVTLGKTGLPVVASTGGRTKYNRTTLGIPKAHCLDAACTGPVLTLTGWDMPVLEIKAMGRGSYRRTRLDKYGFPRGYLMRTKSVRGFQTGDIVRAVVSTGKKAGTYAGRVAVRARGSFNI
jgi:5-methylcytosine-specific restriction endonuclease McrA